MATEQEKIFADEILSAIGSSFKGSDCLTGFFATSGIQYNGELMVVGRAVNGWTSEFRAEDLKYSNDRSKVASEAYSRGVGDVGDPMSWVNDQWGAKTGYNTKRSAFWRVIRNVVGRLSIADIDKEFWATFLTWSNLYKISPCEGGNPSDKLCEIQLIGCRNLFSLELHTYQPKRLLLLTGLTWAKPFLDDFEISENDVNKFEYVESFGQLIIPKRTQHCKFVVACHPQSKLEDSWTEEVVEAFN